MLYEVITISVGQAIPVTERFWVLARRHAKIIENIDYQRIETGFYVKLV